MTNSVAHCTVYLVNLDSTCVEVAQAHLSRIEKQRARRFKHEIDRTRWTTSRLVLRHVLGRELQTDPACVRILTSRTGRPYVPGERIYFSLSRSGSRAMIAISPDCHIGVDLETRALAAHRSAVTAMVLSPLEREGLSGLPKPVIDYVFRRVWVRKEAVLKAGGHGLYYDPRRLCVGIDNEITRLITHNGAQYQVSDLNTRIPASLAVAAPSAQIEIRSFSDLRG